MKLKDTFEMRDVPEMWLGKDSQQYRCDRWQPYSKDDKAISNDLIEKHLDWIPTPNDEVIYGLERWGAILPNEYTEWFSVIVLRHVLVAPRDGLSFAAKANPVGIPRE